MAWLIGWKYRIPWTLAATDAALTDFPARFSLANSALLTAARSDGLDVRFTAADGATLLKYERETWSGGNGSNGTLEAWVKIPTTATASPATRGYLYVGHADAADGQDAANTWETNYRGVWHLNQTGTNPQVLDSTANNHDSSAATWTPSTGIIGGCGAFSGTQHIEIPHASDLVFSASQSFTLSASVYLAGLASAWKGIVTKSRDASPWYGLWLNNLNQWVFGGYPSANLAGSTATLGLHRIACVQDHAANKRYIYIDGTKHANEGAAINNTGTGDLWFAGAKTAALEYFPGSLDEVRLAGVAKSAAWIKAEYASLTNPATFVTFGNLETCGVARRAGLDGGLASLSGGFA